MLAALLYKPKPICDCCQREVERVRSSIWHGDHRICTECFSEWYDPTGQSTTENNPGCWREAEGGKRSVAGRWEKEDLAKAKQPGDVCNNYDAVIDINTPNP